MNDYSDPKYKDLYEEILKDYEWTWGKFNPIPYPTFSNLYYAQQQRNAKTSRTKYQSPRISRGR